MNKKMLFAAATAVLLGGMTLARAETTTIYSGTQCETAQRSALVYWFGLAGNNSSQVLRVLCPIDKHSINGRIKRAWAFVIDWNTTQDVSCTIASCVSYGAALNTCNTDRKSTSWVVVPQQLVFGPVAGIGYGYYLMVCDLPPRQNEQNSSIVSYGVTEE